MSTTDICKKCENKRIIVNKRHYLCNSCNRDRLGSVTKTYELKRVPLKAKTSLKAKTHIKQRSKKQQKTETRLTQIYHKIDSTREQICSGCGTSQYLSHSHIISRYRRPDLVDDPQNITYHCLSYEHHKGCHDKWEGTTDQRKLLLDYDKNMAYIERVDPKYYAELKAREEHEYITSSSNNS